MAKGIRKGSAPERKRKLVVRKKPGRVPLRPLDDEREIHPLTPLFGALQSAKIRFMIIGMGAAVHSAWQGLELPVLPLERIIAVKEFIARDKDLAHLPVLKATLRGVKRLRK